MKITVKIIYVFFSIIFIYYLSLPNLNIPHKLDDALQSREPADVEESTRLSYFTNVERNEVIEYYSDRFVLFPGNGLVLHPVRLNYPPEESKVLIRDQTRSSFLEELVFPMRESIYINGFKPLDPKDAIFIENKNWVEKITVKYIGSEVFERIVLGLLILFTLPLLMKSFLKSFIEFYVYIKKFAV